MKLAVLILAAALGAPSLAKADTTIYPPSGPVVIVDAEPAPAPAPQPGPRQGMRGQRGQRGQRGMAGKQMKQKLVEAFDANGDGQLGPRERRKLLRAVRKLERRLAAAEDRAGRAGQPRGRRHGRGDIIQRFDRNGDGNLGAGELPPRAMKKLQRLDRNNDGWVSPDERPARPAR